MHHTGFSHCTKWTPISSHSFYHCSFNPAQLSADFTATVSLNANASPLWNGPRNDPLLVTSPLCLSLETEPAPLHSGQRLCHFIIKSPNECKPHCSWLMSPETKHALQHNNPPLCVCKHNEPEAGRLLNCGTVCTLRFLVRKRQNTQGEEIMIDFLHLTKQTITFID